MNRDVVVNLFKKVARILEDDKEYEWLADEVKDYLNEIYVNEESEQKPEESVYQKLLRIEEDLHCYQNNLSGVEVEILPSELWLDGYEAGKRSALLSKQPEQTKYIKTKKELEIYFVKDEFGTLRPTFKNPKETPFLIDVLHGGG